jgi:tetratricopeptide (TPR) repeat protein
MQRTNQRRTVLGVVILVSLLAIFVSIVLTTVIIFLVTNRLSKPKSADLSDDKAVMLDIGKIDPALALVSLGGIPEDDLLVEAIEKARPETALSAMLFYPFSPNRETAGNYLRLAVAYGETSELDKAVFCYRQAATIAVLSPNIPDNVRADIFLQAGEGLAALNKVDLSNLYLGQAFILATYSPYLQAVQRRTIFERLNRLYLQLGERLLARQSLDFSANPPPIMTLTGTASNLAPIEPTASSEAIQQVEAIRWQKAQQLAALLVERGGNAPEETYLDLRQALIQEDEQKLSLLEEELVATPQVSGKINVIATQIKWLTTKYKIAKLGYGISLVPEWETDVVQIEAQLTQSYARLFELYDELIVALPEVSQINEAKQEKLRREILFGELGQYPNYPKEMLHQQLVEVTNQILEDRPEVKIVFGTDSKERYIFEARD